MSRLQLEHQSRQSAEPASRNSIPWWCHDCCIRKGLLGQRMKWLGVWTVTWGTFCFQCFLAFLPLPGLGVLPFSICWLLTWGCFLTHLLLLCFLWNPVCFASFHETFLISTHRAFCFNFTPNPPSCPTRTAVYVVCGIFMRVTELKLSCWLSQNHNTMKQWEIVNQHMTKENTIITPTLLQHKKRTLKHKGVQIQQWRDFFFPTSFSLYKSNLLPNPFNRAS